MAQLGASGGASGEVRAAPAVARQWCGGGGEAQVYRVPVVQPDLRREETVQHIADALEALSRISIDIFSRLSQRIEENRSRLQGLDTRLCLAQAKIDHMKGSKKAIKVFSSAKYPAMDGLDDYVSVFTGAGEGGEVRRPRYKLQSKHRVLDERAVKEKLQMYHVGVSRRRRQGDEEAEEGLGGLPRNINSISSLLLFSTAENPYKKYVMLDPLSGAVTKTRTALQEEVGNGPGEAPISIAQREQMERTTLESYFYVPDLGQVPEIDVPSYLPDLPGVADDLAYTLDMGPSIAPSAISAASLPELPSFEPGPGTVAR